MKNQITLRKKLAVLKARKAFSLVELLVVIAVIGIIAAIAIPNIAGITGSATAAKTQRNAQSIASAVSSARAAGCVTSIATVAAGVDAVTTTPGLQGVGNFAGSSFYVPLSAAEITAVKASPLLTCPDGGTSPTTATLVYTTP